MELTSKNGNFETWNHEDLIIRVHKKGAIVIIKNDEGEQTLIRREPYTFQAWTMIKNFYNGKYDSDYDKATDHCHLNPQASELLENFDRVDIEMIDPETAFLSKGDTYGVYRPKKGNCIHINRRKDFALPDRTRWIMEDYSGGYLLHLHSEMDINTFMEKVDAPTIHVYKGKNT